MQYVAPLLTSWQEDKNEIKVAYKSKHIEIHQ